MAYVQVTATSWQYDTLSLSEVRKYRYDASQKMYSNASNQASWYVNVIGVFINGLGNALTALGVAQAIGANYFLSSGGTLEDQHRKYEAIEYTMDRNNYDLAKVKYKMEYIKVYTEDGLAHQGWSISGVPVPTAFHAPNGWVQIEM